MPEAAAKPVGAGRSHASSSALATEASGNYLILPFLACTYALIVFPLLIVGCGYADAQCAQEARPENRIVWPALAAIAIALAIGNRSKLSFPPHILALFAYLAFAGTSVIWAFNPELSFIRFAQQVMIVSSIVLPATISSRKADLITVLYLCFGISVVLNLYFIVVAGRPPLTTEYATWGYTGYFTGKNYLGACAGIAFLLALFEIRRPGIWRILALLVAGIAASLLYLSNSKTSLGLAILGPVLALVTLILRRLVRASPVLLPIAVISCYAFVTSVTAFYVGRLSYIISGEPTFTGRMFIWDFANYEIGLKPLMGWGYQSFWLAGPGSPSIVDGPGWVVPWVRDMPNAHNGYLDTMLELGYIGLVLLVVFILATLHAIGRVSDRDPARGWILLSLSYFVIVSNGLESTWMRSFEFVWVVFLFVVAEVARHGGATPAVIAQTKRDVPPDERHTGTSLTLGRRRVRRDDGHQTARPQQREAVKNTRRRRGLARGEKRPMIKQSQTLSGRS